MFSGSLPSQWLLIALGIGLFFIFHRLIKSERLPGPPGEGILLMSSFVCDPFLPEVDPLIFPFSSSGRMGDPFSFGDYPGSLRFSMGPFPFLFRIVIGPPDAEASVPSAPHHPDGDDDNQDGCEDDQDDQKVFGDSHAVVLGGLDRGGSGCGLGCDRTDG